MEGAMTVDDQGLFLVPGEGATEHRWVFRTVISCEKCGAAAKVEVDTALMKLSSDPVGFRDLEVTEMRRRFEAEHRC